MNGFIHLKHVRINLSCIVQDDLACDKLVFQNKEILVQLDELDGLDQIIHEQECIPVGMSTDRALTVSRRVVEGGGRWESALMHTHPLQKGFAMQCRSVMNRIQLQPHASTENFLV